MPVGAKELTFGNQRLALVHRRSCLPIQQSDHWRTDIKRQFRPHSGRWRTLRRTSASQPHLCDTYD